MTICSFAPRSLVLAGALIGIFTFGAVAQQPANPPAAAAQSAAPALPPGSPLIGRPADSETAAKLAPVAPPPIAAAVDKLPTAKLKVRAGFNIEVYAAGMANARSLAEGDKGTVFVGSRLVGNVYAVANKDGKCSVKVLASGLHRPNGVAFRNGTLYIAELSKVSKIDKVEDSLDSPPKLTMIYDNLPKDEAHGWKFIAIGPDNKLYVPVGQPGNNVLHDDAHGQIRRMNLDGTDVEVVARDVDILEHALADGDARHDDDEFLEAVGLVQLEDRAEIDIGLAGARFHFDGELASLKGGYLLDLIGFLYPLDVFE